MIVVIVICYNRFNAIMNFNCIEIMSLNKLIYYVLSCSTVIQCSFIAYCVNKFAAHSTLG